jgi:hypothetical protein
LEHRQSVGEIVRYRSAPHQKYLIQEKIRKEEEKRMQGEKEKEKKDAKKDPKKDAKEPPSGSKSPSKAAKRDKTSDSILDVRATMDASVVTAVDPAFEAEEKARLEALEEEKRREFFKQISRLRKENLNMICYGLPDVYMMD